jgi:hypothetical protein
MPISYPLSIPTTGIRGIRLSARNVVGVASSPFTGSQQVYRHQGAWWEAEVSLPPMKRADAEEWIGFLLSLKGRSGTFLLGDPAGASPRGTWAVAPLVNGGTQTGETLAVDGFPEGATVKRGDYIQIGSGASTRLYKVLVDATAAAGAITLDIWPRLRESPADNAVVTTSSARGTFRLADNLTSWDVDEMLAYGITFAAVEAI